MSSGWDSATDTTTGESSSASPRPLQPPMLHAPSDRTVTAALGITVVNPASTSSASSASSMAAPASEMVHAATTSTSAQRRRMQRRRHRSPSPPTSPERGSSSSRGRREQAAGFTQRLFHSDPRAQRHHHATAVNTMGSGRYYRPPSANVEHQQQQHMTFSELLEAMISSCGGEWHHQQPGSGASPGGISHFHPRRLEKVKFGVSVDEVCQRCNGELPASLLILLLKLNKQGPHRKDVFRAPGHQASVKSLIGFLQQGRLVNIDNFSVYTLASVLKKFLRKLPGGVFGPQNEAALAALESRMGAELDISVKRERIKQIIRTLSLPTQRLLVLLFGTFSVIALYAESGAAYDILASPGSVKPAHGWAAQALGVSVAPSLFVSLVNTGKQVKREDIQHFKTASDSIAFIIRNFSTGNIFGRENYEYYAHMTGRVLRVDDEWIFTFPFPAERQQILRDKFMAKNICLAQLEAIKWGIGDTVNSPSDPTNRTPFVPSSALLTSSATFDHFDSAEPATHSAPRLRTGSSSVHVVPPHSTPTLSSGSGSQAAFLQHHHSHDLSPFVPASGSTVADLHHGAGLSPLRKRVLSNFNSQSPSQRFSAQSAGAAAISRSDYADQNVPLVQTACSPSASLAGGLQAVVKSPCKSATSSGGSTTQSSSATLTHSSSNSNGSTLVQTSTETSTTTSSSSSNNHGRNLLKTSPLASVSAGEIRQTSKKRLSDNVTRAVHHVIYDEVERNEPYGDGSPQYRQYKSYMSLPEIEERQKLLLAARSQWFLGGNVSKAAKFSSARETGKTLQQRSATPLGDIFLNSGRGTLAGSGDGLNLAPKQLVLAAESAQSSPKNSSLVAAQSAKIHHHQHQSSSVSAHETVMPSNYYFYHRFDEQQHHQRSNLHLSTPSPPQYNKQPQTLFEAVPVQTTSGDEKPPFVSTATVKLYSGSGGLKKPRDDSDSSTAEPLSYAETVADSTWPTESADQFASVTDSLAKRSPKRRPQLSPLILQLQRSLGAAMTGSSVQPVSTGISSSPSCVGFGTTTTNSEDTRMRGNTISAMPVSVSAYAVGDIIGNTSGSSSHTATSGVSRNVAKIVTSITSSSASSAAGMSEADDADETDTTKPIMFYHQQRMPVSLSSAAAELPKNAVGVVTRPFNYFNPSGSLSVAASPQLPQRSQQWEESIPLQSNQLNNTHVVRRGGRAARFLPATGPSTPSSARPAVAADVIIQHRAVPTAEATAAVAHQAAQSRAARFRAPPTSELTSSITIGARGSSSSSSVNTQQQRVARVLPLSEQQNRPPSPPEQHSNTSSPRRVRYVQPPITLSTTSPARYVAGEKKQ